MPLQSGTRLDSYEVAELIGSGGVGEVYRATDTNLNREVAIKVIPESVAGDPERLARFQREARMLAALNHPNIAQIYDVETSGGVHALIMGLVDGPTLADRITQGPIPVDEALPIARQIAEALEAAHGRGVIHRDLKPANVKVRADGTVKVLDFGLAKAMETTGTASPTTSDAPTVSSAGLTSAGVVLGTAAYMSPEQARGHRGRRAHRCLGVRVCALRDAHRYGGVRARPAREERRRRSGAPIPTARTATQASVNPGLRRALRPAWQTSRNSLSSHADRHTVRALDIRGARLPSCCALPRAALA